VGGGNEMLWEGNMRAKEGEEGRENILTVSTPVSQTATTTAKSAGKQNFGSLSEVAPLTCFFFM
jgi:hypothetical protein